jgi:hypothetical protein
VGRLLLRLEEGPRRPRGRWARNRLMLATIALGASEQHDSTMGLCPCAGWVSTCTVGRSASTA